MTTAGPATTVVVHCGHLPVGAALDKRIRSVSRTVPKDVIVIATVVTKTKIHPALARRVRLEVISDGGTQLFDQLFTVDAPFIVLPPAAVVREGWFEPLIKRSNQQPHVLGVLRCADQHLFVCGARARSLEAPRALWEGMPHIDVAFATETGETSEAPPRRSLSAVLIVKNEERVLGACLKALAPVVDEIVVYDTGSADQTLAIARASGARVVEGYWDDDFSAARNRALAHATADWVISVDADELLVGDVEAIRTWIDRATYRTALVDIMNVAYESAQDGVVSRTVRLFRREGARWTGALHEQIEYADGTGTLLPQDVPPLQLIHSGYGVTAMAGKRGRNTQVVRTALAKAPADDASRPDLVAHLSRSLLATGEVEEGLAVAAQLLEAPAASGNMVQLARVVVPLALGDKSSERAQEWIAAARHHGESPGQCAVWEAAVLSAGGDLIAAHSMLTAVVDGPEELRGADYWATRFDVDVAEAALAEIEDHLGDHARAEERILGVLYRKPDVVSLPALKTILSHRGWTTGRLIRSAPEEFLDRSLRDFVMADPSTALVWFAAMVQERPEDPRPVVAGCVVASRSGWRDAVEWELHARARGIAGVSPLSDLADNSSVPHLERAVALGLMMEGFGDETALARLRAVLASAPVVEKMRIRIALQKHVPAAVAALSEGLVTTTH